MRRLGGTTRGFDQRRGAGVNTDRQNLRARSCELRYGGAIAGAQIDDRPRVAADQLVDLADVELAQMVASDHAHGLRIIAHWRIGYDSLPVRTRPDDLTDSDLFNCLSKGWGLKTAQLEYVAVGGGSHHWLALDAAGKRHWVTVDDVANHLFLGSIRADAFARLRCAFDTAVALHETGLEFVVAPLRSKRGQTVEPLGQRYAVAVYPYLAGASGVFGAPRTAAERAQVVDMLGRLHQATPAVAALARPWPVSVASRPALEGALDDLAQPWAGGPFSEPARATLACHAPALSRLLATFDQLAAEVAAAGGDQVITHGEPHPANFMSVDGRLLLVDWDTVALGPPERDLWMLATDTGEALARYTERFGRRLNPAALRLYRLRWLVDDISIVVDGFRSPHERTAEMARAWQGLTRSLASPDIP